MEKLPRRLLSRNKDATSSSCLASSAAEKYFKVLLRGVLLLLLLAVVPKSSPSYLPVTTAMGLNCSTTTVPEGKHDSSCYLRYHTDSKNIVVAPTKLKHRW